MKALADSQAAPLLEQLKTAPTDPALLANIGNVYYDAQQYPTAIDYYGRSLQSAPDNVSVRTDLGTAYWYSGNADAAIAALNKALTYQPTNANTLFNLGLVSGKGSRMPPAPLPTGRSCWPPTPTTREKRMLKR